MTTETTTLDEAWAAAEAALPLAGWMHKGKWVLPRGTWIIEIEYRPSDGDGQTEPYYPPAYFARAEVWGTPDRLWVGDEADTPAAALRALTGAIRDKP